MSLSPSSIPRRTSGFLELPAQAFFQASTLLEGTLCTSCLVGPDTQLCLSTLCVPLPQNKRNLLSATPNQLHHKAPVPSLECSCIFTYKP